jgi:hypothetical protein
LTWAVNAAAAAEPAANASWHRAAIVARVSVGAFAGNHGANQRVNEDNRMRGSPAISSRM